MQEQPIGLKRALAHPLTVPSIKEQQNLLCSARLHRIESISNKYFLKQKHLLTNKCHEILVGNQSHFIPMKSKFREIFVIFVILEFFLDNSQ